MLGRVDQGFAAIAGRRRTVHLPANLAPKLRPGTTEAFGRLATFDQQHLVDVAAELRRRGASEHVVVAGLLHDIGKAAGSRPPTILDRAVVVIARRAAPALIAALQRRGATPRWFSGIWVLACHARLGADMLRPLGYDDSVCDLVASHDDLAFQSPDLTMLRRADDEQARHVLRRRLA